MYLNQLEIVIQFPQIKNVQKMTNRNSSLLSFKGVTPNLAENAFIAKNVAIIGDVVIGENSSIWPGCIIRGDVNYIRIGAYTNVQDSTVIHVDRRDGGQTLIGDYVTIGHMCLLHACTLKNNSFIGMGATVMDHVVVEENAMVAAGSLVTIGKVVRSGELWSGRPAKFYRMLTEEEIYDINASASRYFELSRAYKAVYP